MSTGINLLGGNEALGMPDRRKFIGSSDAPVIMGLVPLEWGTPVELWNEKRSDTQIFRSITKAMDRGTLLEPFIPDMAFRSGVLTFDDIKRDVRFDANDFGFPASAQIDCVFVIDGEEINGEIKTVGFDRNHEWGASDTQDIPARVYCQVQYALAVSKRKLCIVLCWISDELRRYDIASNAEYQQNLVTVCAKFWQQVCQGTAPAPITAKDQNILTPANGSTLEAAPNIYECTLALRGIKNAIKPLEEQEAELTERIKMFMGPAESLIASDGTALATWKNTNPKRKTESDWEDEVGDIKRKFLNPSPQRKLLLKVK